MTLIFKTLLQDFEREPGATQQNLCELHSFAASELPEDYIDLLKFSNGASGRLGGRYLVIFSSTKTIAINHAAGTRNYAPGRLIFASNGGGTSYLLELGQSPLTCVYRCEDVDLGHEQSIRVASSIEEFIRGFGPQIA